MFASKWVKIEDENHGCEFSHVRTWECVGVEEVQIRRIASDYFEVSIDRGRTFEYTPEENFHKAKRYALMLAFAD